MADANGTTFVRPANFENLEGREFGRWVVVAYHSKAPGTKGGSVWFCRCKCGTERPVKAVNLKSGRSKSCGCYHKEVTSNIAMTALKSVNTTHGLSHTREYRAWNQMNQRCHNPRNHTYPRYGALGVAVCQQWRDSFEAFLDDLGECPEGHSLDRIDPFGDYEPSNCRWATDTQQRLNQRRTKRFLYQGEMLAIPELAAKTGIKTTTLRFRLNRMGWPVERATTQNPRDYHDRKGA